MAALYPIRPGMTACLLDGGTATVVDVLESLSRWTGPSLVLCTSSLTGRRVVAPYAAVSYVTASVHLSLSTQQIQRLPAYDPMLHGRQCSTSGRAPATPRRETLEAPEEVALAKPAAVASVAAQEPIFAEPKGGELDGLVVTERESLGVR